MTTALFSTSAIVIYLAAAVWLGRHMFVLKSSPATIKRSLIVLSSIGLLLHLLVLYQNILSEPGLDLGFYNALSLMTWFMMLSLMMLACFRPAENLALFFLPASALALLLELFFDVDETVRTGTSYSTGMRTHIMLSVAAYSLLSIAAVHSLVLAVQESQLHRKKPVSSMRIFPPLQIMEEMLVQLLTIGFFLLSLSLATGMMFVHDVMAQHLAHKTVLSILAWFVFGFVLLGHWLYGWRGRTLIRWTLGGFILLMLAYFGSKLVLELLLERG